MKATKLAEDANDVKDLELSPKLNSDEELVLPPLSIIDLMVLTAAMAIAFAFQESLFGNARMQSESVWFNTIQRIQYALIYALPLAAVYRFVLHKRAVGKFLLQPGHWVLLSILISVVAYMAPVLIRNSISGATETEGFEAEDWGLMVVALGSFMSAAVLFRGAVLYRWAWKAMLLLMGVWLLVVGLQTVAFTFLSSAVMGKWMWVFAILGWIDTVMKVLICIALFPVLWTDFRSAKRRDLWHWSGVLLLFVLNVVGPVLNYIFMRFFTP